MPQRIPLVVIFELYISVGKGTQTDENRKSIDRVVGSFPIIPATEPIAKQAGILEGKLQAERGSGIGTADALIAATALEYDEPVVTGDPDDFRHVPGLDVERY